MYTEQCVQWKVQVQWILDSVECRVYSGAAAAEAVPGCRGCPRLDKCSLWPDIGTFVKKIIPVQTCKLDSNTILKIFELKLRIVIKIDAVGRWVSHTSLILERLDSQINMITFKKKVLTDWILKFKIKVYFTFQQLRLQRI